MSIFGLELNLLGLEIFVGIVLIVLYVIVNIFLLLVQRGKKNFISNLKQYLSWIDAATLLITTFAIIPLVALIVHFAFGVSLVPEPDKIEQSNLYISYLIAIYFYVVMVLNIFTKPKWKGKISDVKYEDDFNANG